MEKGTENGKPEGKARVITVAPLSLSRCSSFLCSEAKPDADHFQAALTELKDLRSQLHQAADYCENAFLKEQKKKMILDSTKSYICDAIVAVIDHLGTVSSKLELELCNISKASQTEQKMDFLRQRLLLCQQFAVTAELATIRYREESMQHHQRYVSHGHILKKHDPREDGSGQKLPNSHQEEKLGSSGRLRLQHMEYEKEQVMILPGWNKYSLQSIGLKETHDFGRDDKKKVQQGNNFLAFLGKNRKRSNLLRRRIG